MTNRFLSVKDLSELFNLKEFWIYDRTSGSGPEVIPHVKFANLKNHVIPVFGTIPIKAISSSDISNFFRALESKKLCSKSVLNVYQLLHVMFEVAAEHDLIDENPVRKKLHRPRHTHKKMPILERRERTEDSSGSPFALESRLLVHCADGRASGGTVGLAVERYRLGREDDHIFSRVLAGPATGIHEDRPGTR